MNAASIAYALGGRKSGSGWSARCPAHDDRTPKSFDQRRRRRKGARALSCRLQSGAGGQSAPSSRLVARKAAAKVVAFVSSSISRTSIGAEQFRPWRSGDGDLEFCAGRAANAGRPYLASRAIELPQLDTLRFHGGLRHPTGGVWPTMVALVQNGADGEPLAIHRTFLAHSGTEKAPLEPAKMMLGPCRGGAVRLAELGSVLLIGEGIETCLAAMLASGHPAWAALSASGLRSLDLPKAVLDVIVLADGDDAGEGAAQASALRWRRQGRRVRIARPPRGLDFNDVLLGRVSQIEEGA